jgi:glutamate synthase domain-containing protein 3
MKTIDAGKTHYKRLNEQIRQAITEGETHLKLLNVNGHRYIGAGLHCKQPVLIEIFGVAGNDMAGFMNGPVTILCNSNAQDTLCNTMNDGKVVVRGNAGDVLGYGMRGGKLFVRGNVGYRVGIHMKQYEGQVPILVVGNRAQDFFGEYLAGGVLVALGLDLEAGESPVGDYVATGMHGGVIFIRGPVEDFRLGEEVRPFAAEQDDWARLKPILDEFAADMGLEGVGFSPDEFIKLQPVSTRPYGKLYAY